MIQLRSYDSACRVLLAGILCCASQVAAQTESNAGRGAAQAAASGNGSPQMEVQVPLVVEDVVVLDHKGRPVHGLRQTDFTVTEDGKPVAVSNFAENTAAPRSGEPLRPPDLGPNTFSNRPRADMGSSLNVLLLDTLNTPFEDQPRVRQQMLSYLRNLDLQTPIAVLGLATHLYLLQGFTSDPALLRTAIERKRGAGFSPLLDDPVSGGPGTAMSDILSSAPLSGSVLASVQEFEDEQETANLELRMVYTLEAMNQLARYLSALPGRKNVIWFSGSFPLHVLPDEDVANPFGAVDSFRDDVRQTAELFAASRVAVYPVDARGLLNNTALSVTNVGSQKSPANGRVNSTTIATSTIAANHKFFTQMNAEYATMDLIAKETGGKAFYMTDDLKQAVEDALDDGENYYTLSYAPANEKWDGSFRKVVIKTDQPDLHLYYRPGYFADRPDASASWGQKILPADPMQTAMLRGGPDATQVIFDVGFVPAAKPNDQLTAGAHADQKRMRPPYINYMARVLVDLKTVQMTVDEEGVHHGAMGLAVVAYDGDGEAVNSTSKQFTIDVPADRYREALDQGAGAHVDIDVPVKGEYFLRVGVQDLECNHVGALEAPVSALESFDKLQIEAAREAKQNSRK